MIHTVALTVVNAAHPSDARSAITQRHEGGGVDVLDLLGAGPGLQRRQRLDDLGAGGHQGLGLVRDNRRVRSVGLGLDPA